MDNWEKAYQGQVLGGGLSDLVGEHGIEGIKVLHCHREVVGVVDKALPAIGSMEIRGEGNILDGEKGGDC